MWDGVDLCHLLSCLLTQWDADSLLFKLLNKAGESIFALGGSNVYALLIYPSTKYIISLEYLH
jgi:hypothetical protein